MKISVISSYNKPSQRDAGLDAGRGLLMALGLVLHVGNIYRVESPWLVVDQQQSVFFDWLVEAIHSFRMPAFFVVSGYFASLVLSRRGGRRYTADRLQRLGLPLLVVWLAFNALQQGLDHTPGPAPAWLPWLPPLYHLWFLLDLLFLTPVLVVLNPALLALAKRLDRFERLAAWQAIAGLASGVMAMSLLARASGYGFFHIFNLTWPDRLCTDLGYLAFGMLLHGSVVLKAAFMRLSVWWALPALAAGAWLALQTVPDGWLSEVRLFAYLLAAAVMTAVVWVLCARWFQRDSAFTRALADTSYTLYLVHHLLVVCLGTLLLPLVWPAAIKFVVVGLVTLALCLAVHYRLVRRVSWIGLLLNGRR